MNLKLADCEGQDRAKARPRIFEEELGRRLATNMHGTRNEERRISANIAKSGVLRRRKKLTFNADPPVIPNSTGQLSIGDSMQER